MAHTFYLSEVFLELESQTTRNNIRFIKYARNMSISSQHFKFKHRVVSKIFRRCKLAYTSNRIMKITNYSTELRRSFGFRKDVRKVNTKMLFPEEMSQNYSQATLLSLTKFIINNDPCKKCRYIPYLAKGLEISLPFTVGRLFGRYDARAILRAIKEMTHLPYLKELVLNFQVEENSFGLLEEAQVLKIFLPRKFEKIEHFACKFNYLGTAYAMLAGKPSHLSIKSLNLCFKVMFDLGQELTNLKSFLSVMIHLKQLKLEFSGNKIDINYQFQKIVELLTLQNLELLHFIPVVKQDNSHSIDNFCVLSILPRNINCLNSTLSKLECLREFQVLYDYAPYDSFRKGPYYLEFSRLKSLENLSIVRPCKGQNSEERKTILPFIFRETSQLQNLKKFTFLTGDLLIDYEVLQIINSLSNCFKLKTIMIYTKHLSNLQENISFTTRSTRRGLEELTLMFKCTSNENLEKIVQFLESQLLLNSLSLCIDYKEANLYSTQLFSLKELNYLKAFKLYTNNPNLFNADNFLSLGNLIKRNSALEIFSINLVCSFDRKNGLAIHPHCVKLEEANLLFEKIYCRSFHKLEVNFTLIVEDKRVFENMICQVQDVRIKYLSFFIAVFQKNSTTPFESIILLAILREIRKLGKIQNLHIGIDFNNLKHSKVFLSRINEILANIYHLEKINFELSLPTEDSYLSKTLFNRT